MNIELLLKNGQQLAVDFGVKIVAALAIFIIGRWVIKLVVGMLRRALQRAKVDEMLVRFVGNLAYALLLTIVVLASISQIGVQTTSFVAILGAAGLAVGLALQGSLANFAAGVLLIIFRPYKMGDFIEGGGVTGVVKEVQIFTTVLTSPDNKLIIVPNGQMMSSTITNYSANDQRRVDLVMGVGYDDDLDKARKVMQEVVEANPLVLKDPAPTIAVSELADSSVNFVVRPWVKTADYWTAFFEITETIKKRFDAEGISIPFPQRDVHVYNHDNDKAAAA